MHQQLTLYDYWQNLHSFIPHINYLGVLIDEVCFSWSQEENYAVRHFSKYDALLSLSFEESYLFRHLVIMYNHLYSTGMLKGSYTAIEHMGIENMNHNNTKKI